MMNDNYRLKLKKTKDMGTEKWFLQKRKWLFLWEDVSIRTMRMYSIDERRLINTFENTFNVKVILQHRVGDVIKLMCNNN